MARIAVLMSGGVDSSGAALVLQRAGHDLIGLTARMFGGASKCCGDDDIYRAQRVCHKLGIPHRVLDLTGEFDKLVISDFVESYVTGLTPNPCSICNRSIKFGVMLAAARSFGYDRLASGHYARLAEIGGKLVLAEPADPRKSQVYFLGLVAQEALACLDFPLASFGKRDVRTMIEAAGLPARETESQDLCFIVSGRYEEVLKARSTWPGPGDVLDTEGHPIGRHRGHMAYTIGQRFGLDGKRLYVLSKCAARNEITVGSRERAMVRAITARPVNYFRGVEIGSGSVVSVRYRYNSPLVDAVITEETSAHIRVLLDQPGFAPAPGQILACYRDDFLVRAGTIAGTD
ncbi:MAG TPA: tRNA 2-thiouridine(34) synthase MnmA [bacterium]|nr:tRNA 2-thiouridine(34) synthase MnmA [bacterium]